MLIALLLLAAQTVSSGQVYSPTVLELVAGHARLAPGELAKRLEALAAGGDPSAAQALGELTAQGRFGIAADPRTACDWYERASAFRGDSTHNLAMCFETGEGRPQDLARARSLYATAADQGWVQAKCALGTLLVSGSGGERDAARGVALCREAAEAGNANAQTDYANYLLMGQVVPKDVVAARRWYLAAAEQKQGNAAFVLAQIYWKGDGTPVDHAAAERWWRVAYDNGRADAAAWIVQAVFERMITEKDGKETVDRSLLPEAVHWLEIAAGKDPDPAKRAKFAKVLESLTTE